MRKILVKIDIYIYISLTRILSEHQLLVLETAKKRVSDCFCGDIYARLLYGTNENIAHERIQMWKEIVLEFSPFGERIQQIKQIVDLAYQTLSEYDLAYERVFAMHFSKVQDVFARNFLTLVLTSRMSESVGYLDYKLNSTEEARDMLNQIGLVGNFQDSRIQTITLQDVVEKALTGELRLTTGTPQEQIQTNF